MQFFCGASAERSGMSPCILDIGDILDNMRADDCPRAAAGVDYNLSAMAGEPPQRTVVRPLRGGK